MALGHVPRQRFLLDEKTLVIPTLMVPTRNPKGNQPPGINTEPSK